MVSQYGIVVIGRNEGDRLNRCLESLPKKTGIIVYVDSGSTDDSIKNASSFGACIVQLDPAIPFSAGRARNAGFKFLVERLESLKYVQFLDGDCELAGGWIDFAVHHLQKNSEWAIVSGRLKEKYPDKSIYNQLCDIEWDTPIGESKSCGGIFMVRKEAFQDAEGFNPSLIAGEEPELCHRMRLRRWKIHRVDHLMAFHDASILHFSQWWKRAIRSGHAYAHGVRLYGFGKEKYCLKDSLRIWFWAMLLPVFILSLSILISPWILVFISIYLLQFFRVATDKNKSTRNWKFSFYYALFNVIGKWAQLIGQFAFLKSRLTGKRQKIIEYK